MKHCTITVYECSTTIYYINSRVQWLRATGFVPTSVGIKIILANRGYDVKSPGYV